MIDFAIMLVVNALLIIGVHTAFRTDMVFGLIGDYIASRCPTLAKPLIDCPPCMSSVWGAGFYLATNSFSPVWMVVHILSLCGLLRFLSKWLEEEGAEG